MSTAMNFDGKVVVVTGAGAGLGRCHALEFARRGARVVVNDLGGEAHGGGQSVKAADAVVNEILAQGGDAVANYDSVEDGEKIIQTALDNFDGVDVLVNNAGILRDRSFAKMTDEDWDLVYRVHALGTYYVTKAAWPIMLEQGYGRIVNTSSGAGLYGNYGQVNYAFAKLGIHGMTQSLAIEGNKKGIIVNTIAPAAGTRMLATIMPQKVLDGLKPELVTPLVIKLCAESNRETNGLFEVGAGWVAKVRWQRAAGVLFGADAELTPEMVEDSWEQITDFSDAVYPTGIQDTFDVVFKAIGVEMPA